MSYSQALSCPGDRKIEKKKPKKKRKKKKKKKKKERRKKKEKPSTKRHHMVSGTLALLYTVFELKLGCSGAAAPIGDKVR